MKTSELKEKLKLNVVTTEEYVDSEITGCYICDLLSHVMAKAKPGNIWITVQTNVNVVAVAALTDVACVIIPEKIQIEQHTVDKANEKGVILLSSALDSFTLCRMLNDLL
ncbi:MAG: AraC family transcriptional regulator [Clostridiaceae bacterium]|nr:AraC family transcriptional regulator [Clostridiaceae bacterium]